MEESVDLIGELLVLRLENGFLTGEGLEGGGVARRVGGDYLGRLVTALLGSESIHLVGVLRVHVLDHPIECLNLLLELLDLH